MKTFQKDNKLYNKEKCEFFGALGILHQLILGFLTFSLLILKRFLEKPRRHWIIWFYDILKQIITSFVLYFTNIIFAYLLVNKGGDKDLCTVYFMNLFLGCIGGYYITSLYLKLFLYLQKEYKISICFNEIYYEKIYINNKKSFRIKKKVYILEIIFWTLIQLIWKFILLILFSFFKLLFISLGELILSPFKDVKIKSLMILCFFPLFFNGFYYWKLDTLIKIKSNPKYKIITINNGEIEC